MGKLRFRKFQSTWKRAKVWTFPWKTFPEKYCEMNSNKFTLVVLFDVGGENLCHVVDLWAWDWELRDRMIIVALPQLFWVRHFLFCLSFASPLRDEQVRTNFGEQCRQGSTAPVGSLCGFLLPHRCRLGGPWHGGRGYRRFVTCLDVWKVAVVWALCDLCPLHPLLQVKCDGPCRMPLSKDSVYAVCTFCGTVQPGDRRWEAGCGRCTCYMFDIWLIVKVWCW